MAPSLKLYYFDNTGKAEPIRLILVCGKIPFEDVRLAREDWPKLKPEMPFGQVPVLEVDGKKFGQSVAISRFVGKLAKLDGDNDLENLEIDSLVDSFSDVQTKIMDLRHEKDEAKKATLKEQQLSETLPVICKKWEARATENGGYMALKKLTYADILFVCFCEASRNVLGQNFLANYPNLIKVKQNVLSNPAIKTYLQNRKENPMYAYDLKNEL